LGTNAARDIPVDADLKIDPQVLIDGIRRDRLAGLLPFMIVGTAGTTSAGVIDPIEKLSEIAGTEGVWLHTDAAWGGAAVLVPELRPFLNGIERSDSITLDAHKWLSVPMAAGIFLTRQPDILDRACRMTADYMPREGASLDVVDPYTHSLQWSRRFIGLKLFLSLAVAGWSGYESAIRHQTAMGNLLREKLRAAGWIIVNRTPLPLVCFVDHNSAEGQSARYAEAIVHDVVSSGRTWISSVRIGETAALRACITNVRTTERDLDVLVGVVNDARRRIAHSPPWAQ
jgi:glutamate/tyrosine decarboxylase-like PLP-dependent enzyme